MSLDDAPETVDIDSTSMTSCAACGSFLLGSEESCPSCGVTLPLPRSAPVGASAVVPGAKPAGANTLGAPRPKNAEEAQIWAGLPVGWSKDGDTNPDPVPAPSTGKPPIPPTPVASPLPVSPSQVAPPPVPAPFLSAPIAPARATATPSPTGTGSPIESMPAGKGLELATPKKSQTKDWDRKWQRAESEAKRSRPRSSGRGRAVLYLFGFLVVAGVGGAMAAQSFGLLAPLATPTPVAAASASETHTTVATVEPTPSPTPATPTPTPAKLLPMVTREKRLARAEALATKGKLADAIKEYDLLLEFEPELAEVHFRQASLYAKLKNYGKACVGYRRYLEIEPEGDHAKVANAGAVRCR